MRKYILFYQIRINVYTRFLEKSQQSYIPAHYIVRVRKIRQKQVKTKAGKNSVNIIPTFHDIMLGGYVFRFVHFVGLFCGVCLEKYTRGIQISSKAKDQRFTVELRRTAQFETMTGNSSLDTKYNIKP